MIVILPNGSSIVDRRILLNVVSVISLVLGLGGSVWIYQTALNTSRVLGYEEGNGSAYPVAPEDSKLFLRDLELYGGKANIVAYKLRTWFTGLWHGKSLAVIVGCATILASFGCYYAANHTPTGKNPDADHSSTTPTNVIQK